MIKRGQPLTREQWPKRNYIFEKDGVPDPVQTEVEASMPPPFRKSFDDSRLPALRTSETAKPF
jgi:hypothetical protein